MIDLQLTNKLQLLLDVTVRVRLSDGLGLEEDTEIGKMRKRDNMLHSMSEADILTDLAVDFGWNSSVDDALDGHVFDDVFDRDVEGDHVLVVLDELTVVPLEEGLLLEEELLVEANSFDVFLQGCDEVEIYIANIIRVAKYYFSTLILFTAFPF